MSEKSLHLHTLHIPDLSSLLLDRKETVSVPEPYASMLAHDIALLDPEMMIINIEDGKDIMFASKVSPHVIMSTAQKLHDHYARMRTERIEVATPFGTLIAEYSGDPGIYDGIAIELHKENEVSTLAVIESAVEDAMSDDPIYPTAFHTFAYDGVNEEPTRIDFDATGPMAGQ